MSVRIASISGASMALVEERFSHEREPHPHDDTAKELAGNRLAALSRRTTA